MFCEDLESAWPVFEDCLTELAVPKHFTLVDYLTLERTAVLRESRMSLRSC